MEKSLKADRRTISLVTVSFSGVLIIKLLPDLSKFPDSIKAATFIPLFIVAILCVTWVAASIVNIACMIFDQRRMTFNVIQLVSNILFAIAALYVTPNNDKALNAFFNQPTLMALIVGLWICWTYTALFDLILLEMNLRATSKSIQKVPDELTSLPQDN
jgi:hypothetical protein